MDRRFILSIIGLFLLIAAITIVEVYQEAAAYNRITGSHVTAWDALWIELRVQAAPVARDTVP